MCILVVVPSVDTSPGRTIRRTSYRLRAERGSGRARLPRVTEGRTCDRRIRSCDSHPSDPGVHERVGIGIDPGFLSKLSDGGLQSGLASVDATVTTEAVKSWLVDVRGFELQ
eukprot:SAG11_NODE_5850_length_1448_cov_1.867309_1_plen_112_part_00